MPRVNQRPFRRWSRGPVVGMLFLILFGAAYGLSGDDAPEANYLTVMAREQSFTFALEMDGELEAKVSRALTTPRVRTRPTVAFLAEDGASVARDDVVVVFESEELVSNYRVALDELAIARAESKQTEADLALQRLMLEAELLRLKSAAATAQLQLPRLEFAAPRLREIQSLEMRKSQLEADKVSRKLAALKDIEIEEIKHLDLKEQQADLKLKSTRYFLDKLTLRAPVNGIIIRSRNWSTGTSVQEGDALGGGWPVANIPDLTVLQVKARVGETDAQRLEENQKATVTVPSLGGVVLPGHIASVANVATPVKRNSQVKMVEVVVEVDSTVSGLVPGLSASCRVSLNEVGLSLVIPLECVFDQDSLKVVYAREDTWFTRHTVKVAHQGNDFAVITDGIEPGTELMLRMPPAARIRPD